MEADRLAQRKNQTSLINILPDWHHDTSVSWEHFPSRRTHRYCEDISSCCGGCEQTPLVNMTKKRGGAEQSVPRVCFVLPLHVDTCNVAF